MRVLSLFSGGGLGDYGLTLAGMEIVGQVEIDEYCQKILALRWPDVPKWMDIRDVKGKEIIERCGRIDLVSGGFPCQPFSVAGKRKGAADDRNLWPEMFRIISEVRPTWVLAENVSGVLGYMESVVFPDLERAGYEILPPLVFPAHALGAPHRRERVWIVAYSGHRSGRNFGASQEGETSARKRPADHGPARGPSEQSVEEFAAAKCGGEALAHSESRRRTESPDGKRKTGQPSRCGQNMADAEGVGFGSGLRTDEPPRKWRGRFSDA